MTARLAPGSVAVDLVRTDLAPPRHLAFLLEIPFIRPVMRGLSVTRGLAYGAATGSIRLRIDSDAQVSVGILPAPVTLRGLGSPAPVGQLGSQAPAGLQDPPGTLDTRIVLDSGIF